MVKEHLQQEIATTIRKKAFTEENLKKKLIEESNEKNIYVYIIVSIIYINEINEIFLKMEKGRQTTI